MDFPDLVTIKSSFASLDADIGSVPGTITMPNCYCFDLVAPSCRISSRVVHAMWMLIL